MSKSGLYYRNFGPFLGADGICTTYQEIDRDSSISAEEFQKRARTYAAKQAAYDKRYTTRCERCGSRSIHWDEGATAASQSKSSAQRRPL